MEQDKKARRRDGDARLRSLLDAAIEAFASLGYTRASVRQITELAGANVSAVKYYFGDKAGMYHAALEEAHQRLLAEEELPNLEELVPSEALRVWLRHGVRTALRARTGILPSARLMLKAASEAEEVPRLEDLALQMALPMRHLVKSILRRMVPSASEEALERACGFVLMFATRFSEPTKSLSRLGVEVRDQGVDALIEDAWRFLEGGVYGFLRADQEKERSR